MSDTFGTQLTALFLATLTLFTPAGWAAGPDMVSSVRTTGAVMINSIPIPDGGTARAGDEIATLPGALAILSPRSLGRIEVRSDSRARLLPGALQLDRGAAASAQLPIRIEGFTIRPQNPGPAWFVAARKDNRLLVAAYRGSLLIDSPGGPALAVPEGAYAQQPDPQTSDKPAPAQTSGPSGAATAAKAGWTIGSLSHAASVALVAGLGAAATAAATAAAITLSNSSPSPSH